MKYYILEEVYNQLTLKTAGSKARWDVEDILKDKGYKEIIIKPDRNADENNFNIKNHYSMMKIWENSLEILKKDDVLVLQFPLVNKCIFLDNVINKLKKRGIITIVIIHDLESLRQKNISPIKSRLKRIIEDKILLKKFDHIIVHNDKMKRYLEDQGVGSSKMYELKIFDYLCNFNVESDQSNVDTTVVIAGTLRKHKAAYIYTLPKSEVLYNLYGVGYEGEENEKIKYNGSFDPNILPSVIKGSYGLVWDGNLAETCGGSYGNYLRYNNPHKVSLYLSAGIPVIIWSESAMAEFVIKNHLGIAVSSLYDIQNSINSVNLEEYANMKINAIRISKKLHDGYFLKHVLGEIELRISKY